MKLSHYRPVHAVRAPGGLGFPEFIEKLHMKVARLSTLGTFRRYPRGIYPWYSFLLEAEPIPWP
jgi:hypothetical protein